MDIARGLKYFRAKKGITQTELAKFLGVNNSNVSNWEKGIAKPDIDMLVRIADYFEISVDELIFVEKNQQEIQLNLTPQNLRPKSPPKISAQSENVRAKCEGNLTPQLEPKQYDPNDGLIHDFEADPISDQKRMDTLGLLVERLQQEVKVLKQEVASRDAIIEAKNEVITTQKEAISIATNQLSAATAAMENVAVYLNKGSKKPSTPPDALSASDVDASG